MQSEYDFQDDAVFFEIKKNKIPAKWTFQRKCICCGKTVILNTKDQRAIKGLQNYVDTGQLDIEIVYRKFFIGSDLVFLINSICPVCQKDIDNSVEFKLLSYI